MNFIYSTNSALDEAQSIFLCAHTEKKQKKQQSLSWIDYSFFFPNESEGPAGDMS